MIEILNNPKYKKVYLSGPISGINDRNIKAFSNYEEKLKIAGFIVINPHSLHTQYQIDNNTWEQFMRTDIKAMMDCDFIAVMPGWANSRGANMEVMICRSLNMPIIDVETLKELF